MTVEIGKLEAVFPVFKGTRFTVCVHDEKNLEGDYVASIDEVVLFGFGRTPTRALIDLGAVIQREADFIIQEVLAKKGKHST